MGSANVEQMTNVRQLRENPFVEKRVHLLQPLQRPMAILLLVMYVNIFFKFIFQANNFNVDVVESFVHDNAVFHVIFSVK